MRSVEIAVKEVFGVAQPLAGLEIQTGGLYIARGESTEATSYDNDGYLVGERIVARRGLRALVDEVSVTRAFLGDLAEADVFRRLRHLDRANYYQVLGTKRLARRAAVSADYTRQDATRVVRGAVSLDTAGWPLVTRIRFENYARLAPDSAYGYAVTVQRQLTRRVTTGGGFSAIDGDYGALNSDLNRSGRRAYASLSARLGAAWLASAQVARAVGRDAGAGARTRVDVALGFDVLRALARDSIARR